MEKIAFRMQLHPGQEEEYRRRHDAIWPELVEALRGAGVADYSIHLDRATGALFATLWRREDHGMEALPALPVMRRWWDYMADIMEVEADNSPVSIPLEPVFHLDPPDWEGREGNALPRVWDAAK